jgi:hypothetical protein
LSRRIVALPASVRWSACERRSLQAVEQGDEVGALDAERGAHLRLGAAGIMRDDGEHGELRRPDAELGEGAENILEHRDLRASQHVADQAGERTEIDVRACSHAGAVFRACSAAAHASTPGIRRVDNSMIVMQHYK